MPAFLGFSRNHVGKHVSGPGVECSVCFTKPQARETHFSPGCAIAFKETFELDLGSTSKRPKIVRLLFGRGWLNT